MRAQLALGDDPQYRWLFDRGDLEGGRPRAWRPALLGELGRLAQEQGKPTMREVAAELCAQEPDTAEALRIIRARRLATGAEPAVALSGRLLELIRDYREQHPEVSADQIVAAIDDALAMTLAEAER